MCQTLKTIQPPAMRPLQICRLRSQDSLHQTSRQPSSSNSLQRATSSRQIDIPWASSRSSRQSSIQRFFSSALNRRRVAHLRIPSINDCHDCLGIDKQTKALTRRFLATFCWHVNNKKNIVLTLNFYSCLTLASNFHIS